MRRTLFIALLTLLPHPAFAEYVPFVVEGKTWVVEYDLSLATQVIPKTFTLTGDTVVREKHYKKFLYGGKVYKGAFREENRKVFFLPNKATEEQLYYDFTLHTGDSFLPQKSSSQDYEVYIDDTIQTCGHALHRLGLYYPNNSEYSSIATVQNLWIEGVGSLYGPEFSIYLGWTGSNVRVRSCRVGEENIYKDTMHEFITPGTSWIDGYTRDNQYFLNYHYVDGNQCIAGQTYTVMHVHQYRVSPHREVIKNLSTEYLLREDADGESWIYMEKPQIIAALYGIEWDVETCKSLANRSLYLFNTRARSLIYVTYGLLSPEDNMDDKWQIIKTTPQGCGFCMLEDGSHTWWRDLFPEKNLRMIANVGWTGYGPLYGLGDTADEGQRIFPILWENKHVVYEDKDVLKAMEMSSSELWDITTHIETIENSQIADYIDGAFYDLQGRRLNARPQRGLYIQGGKMRMAW